MIMSICCCCCLFVRQHKSSPDQGHSISAKYLQTVLSVLLLARYTLQALEILFFFFFELAFMGTPIDHTQIPDHTFNMEQ